MFSDERTRETLKEIKTPSCEKTKTTKQQGWARVLIAHSRNTNVLPAPYGAVFIRRDRGERIVELSIPDLRFYAHEPGKVTHDRTVLLCIHSWRPGGAAFPRRSTEGGPSFRNERYRTQIGEKIKREGEIRRAKNEEEKAANKKRARTTTEGGKELYIS